MRQVMITGLHTAHEEDDEEFPPASQLEHLEYPV
jgi:hypothetical protein